MRKGIHRRKGDWVVIYVRVSTDEQAVGALNLDNQERLCQEYCERQRWLEGWDTGPHRAI